MHLPAELKLDARSLEVLIGSLLLVEENLTRGCVGEHMEVGLVRFVEEVALWIKG